MPPSVLIVDDEKSICDNLAAFLEDEGMRAVVAHSGEEALEMVQQGFAVDVCIMDLRLPGMTGAQAILRIREQEPGIRFVVHTGSANDKVIDELQRTGLQDIQVFSKPVKDMGRMAQAIRSLWTAP